MHNNLYFFTSRLSCWWDCWRPRISFNNIYMVWFCQTSHGCLWWRCVCWVYWLQFWWWWPYWQRGWGWQGELPGKGKLLSWAGEHGVPYTDSSETGDSLEKWMFNARRVVKAFIQLSWAGEHGLIVNQSKTGDSCEKYVMNFVKTFNLSN